VFCKKRDVVVANFATTTEHGAIVGKTQTNLGYTIFVGAPLAAPGNIENASFLTKHPPPAGGTLFTKEGKEWS